MMTRPALSRRTAVFAALVGFALSAPVAAQAFTFQDGEGAGGNRSGYKDLDIPKVPDKAPDSRFNYGAGETSVREGNTSFRFGSRPSFNEQYNPSNMFNPYYRDGRW